MLIHPSFYGLQRLGQELKINRPKCFEISHHVFRYYFEWTSLRKLIQEKLRGVDPEDEGSLEAYSRQIRVLVRDTPLPPQIIIEIYELYYELSNGFSTDHHTVCMQSVVEPMEFKKYPVEEELAKKGIDGPAELSSFIHRAYTRLFSPRMLRFFINGTFQLEDTGVTIAIQEHVFHRGWTYGIAHRNEDGKAIEVIAGYGLPSYSWITGEKRIFSA